jgi:hypothetical protein
LESDHDGAIALKVQERRNELMNNTTEPHTARDRFETLVPSSYEFMDHGFQLANEAEYAQVLQGIEAHKYLTNEKIPFEITMDDALFSWYENVYRPIDQAIERAGLVYDFPEATRAQLFLWVTNHWHFLKLETGREVSAEEAAFSYGSRFGSSVFHRFLNRVKLLVA